MINLMRKKIILFMGKVLFPKIPGRIFSIRPPKRVIIEPTNICNLRCTLCPTTTMKRKRGMISFEEFKKICDSLPKSVKYIDLFFAGEPLLNPELSNMIKYTTKKGIKVSVSTNCMLLDKYSSQLLDSGLDQLIVAIDGASKETHEKYRVGSNFEQVIKNVKKLCLDKKRKKLNKPTIILQFIVMRSNEHEIREIVRLGKELGVDKVVLKSVSLGSNRNIKEKLKLKKEYLPKNKKYSRYKYEELRQNSSYCYWIWSSVILWTGDVTTCCYDFNGENVFSNVFEAGGFMNVWKSKKYGHIRKAMLNKKFDLCKNCNITDNYYKEVFEF